MENINAEFVRKHFAAKAELFKIKEQQAEANALSIATKNCGTMFKHIIQQVLQDGRYGIVYIDMYERTYEYASYAEADPEYRWIVKKIPKIIEGENNTQCEFDQLNRFARSLGFDVDHRGWSNTFVYRPR